MWMKPSKTDTSGAKAFMQTFIVDDTLGALYAGRELVYMFDRDPEAGEKELVPLFRMPSTGKEITCDEYRSHL